MPGIQGYLLDTNIIEFWFDPGHGPEQRARHEAVCNRVGPIPAEAPLMTSFIVIGEIEYGFAWPRRRNASASLNWRSSFVTDFPE